MMFRFHALTMTSTSWSSKSPSQTRSVIVFNPVCREQLTAKCVVAAKNW